MADLVTITLNSGKRVTVAREAAGQFKGFLDELEASGYRVNPSGGYANRQNVNNPKYKSKHALGYAIDINPSKNPNIRGVSREARAKNPTKYTDMPIETVQRLAKKWSIGWGYNWKTLSDAMHFSVAPNEGGKPLNLPIDGKTAPAGTGQSEQPQQPTYNTISPIETPKAPEVQAQNLDDMYKAPEVQSTPQPQNVFAGTGVHAILGTSPAQTAVQQANDSLNGNSLFGNQPLFGGMSSLFDMVDVNG